MSDCPHCANLQAELKQTRKQLSIRMDRDGYVKMTATALTANLLPHRNMTPEMVVKQAFQTAHIMWQELQKYRETYSDE